MQRRSVTHFRRACYKPPPFGSALGAPGPPCCAHPSPHCSSNASSSSSSSYNTTHMARYTSSETSSDKQDTPWAIGPYWTKQKERRLGALGEVLESPETVDEPLGWTPDGKLRLAIQVVSQELKRPEQEVTQRVELLQSLLPDLADHLGSLKVADLVRLCADLEEIAEKLLILRKALPAANVSHIVAGNLGLLRLTNTQLQRNLEQVEALCAPHAPASVWQALLVKVPMLTDAVQLQATLSEVARLFQVTPQGGRAVALLIASPELALSCQDLKPQGGNNTDD